MLTSKPHSFRLRSFVRRNSRMTDGQARAYHTLWPRFGLSLTQGMLNGVEMFGREAPCVLEVGFGSGVSLLSLAKSRPDLNLIGIETHRPGIGALLMGIEAAGIQNLRIYEADVVDVLANAIPAMSLDSVQIFFPDPWQKRRHHPRRLVQSAFIKTVIEKLKPEGTIHLATDWEDYATHILSVLSTEPSLVNLAEARVFAERSPYRPITTKFERRALKEGRPIKELQFKLLSRNGLR